MSYTYQRDSSKEPSVIEIYNTNTQSITIQKGELEKALPWISRIEYLARCIWRKCSEDWIYQWIFGCKWTNKLLMNIIQEAEPTSHA